MSLSDWFLPSGSMTSAEQQANYSRLQAEYQRRADRNLSTGTISPAEYADIVAAGQGSLESQDLAAWDGFKQGAAEGLDNVLSAPGKAVGMAGDASGKLLGGILWNVPWWLYLAAGAALFVWMGGLTLLRGRLAR